MSAHETAIIENDMSVEQFDVEPSRRRWPWLMAALLVAAGGAGLWLATRSTDTATVDEEVPLRFAEVVIRDLEEVTSLDGTLGRAESEAIGAVAGGTVTAAAEPGVTVNVGEVLFEIDAEPVVLLQGSLPAYRDLTLSADTVTIVARLAGTVTAVIEEGTPVSQGDVVFQIDGRPVVVLYGDVPAYRAMLDLTDNLVGDDVAQLEAALDALGFNDGDVTVDDEFTAATEQMVEEWQEAIGAEEDGVVDLGEVIFIGAPSEVVAVHAATGDTVAPGTPMFELAGDEPMTGDDVLALETSLQLLGYDPGPVDGAFTSDTRSAVIDWQAATGLEGDGVVNLGEVVFRPGPVRVSDRATAPGSQVGPGGAVLAVTSSDIVVTAQLAPQDQGLLDVGDAVVVELPDNSEIGGSVGEVASVVTVVPGGENYFEVTILLDDPAQAGTLDEAPVEVSVVTDSVSGVKAVPVTALLALQEGGYAVEVAEADGGTRLVAVDPGFFADGFVEIAADGVAVGDQVVVP